MIIANYEISESIIARPAVVHISALATEATIVDQMLRVNLRDGRMVAVPLDWFPMIAEAAPAQQANIEIQAEGDNLYWPEIGARLFVPGLLAGADPCSNCWYRVSFYR